MPGGDGTGPSGMGPMTGRAAGYCAGYTVPGSANRIGGRYSGFGKGGFGGRGRSCHNWFNATGTHGWQRYNTGLPAWGTGYYGYPDYDNPNMKNADPEEEVKILKDQADMLEQQLDNINNRINEIGQATKNEKK